MKRMTSNRSSRLLWPAVVGALALSLQVNAQTQGPATTSPAGTPATQPARTNNAGMANAGPAATGARMSAANDTATHGSAWARQQSLRASRVIGSSVRNPQGQDIGQVEDMVVNLDTGKVRYVVLSFDPGILQLERVYAVPVERLRMLDDQVVIDIPRARLEQSGIESAGWSKNYFQDRARIARLDTDWGLGDRAPEQLVRASDLMRTDIVAANGDKIGSIDEVVFLPGRQQVQYVVVAFDSGWLGRDKRAAIDLASLHRGRRSDELALVADRATVQAMRPFTVDRYGYFGDGNFVNRETRRTMGAGGNGQVR